MDEEELYSLISFIEMSEHRTKITEFLQEQDEPKTPTDIARSTEIHRNHVSNQLNRMKEKDLVKVLNPDSPRNRYYRLTEKGEQILSELD